MASLSNQKRGGEEGRRKSQMDNLIAFNFLNPCHFLAFTSGQPAINYYKGDASQQTIKSALQKVSAYTKNKVTRNQKQFNNFFSYFRRECVQIDLADVSYLSRFNRGIKFLLLAIDSASRFVWCEPIKNKSARTVTDAFKRILSSMDKAPARILSDQGKEFFDDRYQLGNGHR